MDSLIKVQINCNRSINKAKINFKKSPKERVTTSYIETRLEALESQWLQFVQNNNKLIADYDLDNTEYYKADVFQVTEELYFDYKSELKDALKNLVDKEEHTLKLDRRQEPVCNVKLPKITLPVFSGNYNEWISFRDLFLSLIHNNNNLDNVQRLQYLKSHLTGEAEKLLRYVPITSNNYSVCWSQLEHRYNNKRYLANCILRRLINQKNIAVETSTSIKELLDTTNECLHALKNLDIDVSTWDVIIIYIISQKLDAQSRKEWELYVGDFSQDLPKLNQFNDFLEHRYRALEFIDPKGNKQYSRNNDIKAHHVSNVFPCFYCSGDHKLYNCKKFATQDVDSRRNFVQLKKLCFNCLGLNHSVYSCRQSTRCRLCKRKHHSLLHISQSSEPDEDANTDNSVNENPSTSSQSETDNVISCHSNIYSEVLLATAMVRIKARNGNFIVFRSLLDQGSQASFITEAAVQMLGLKKIPNTSMISGIGGDDSKLSSRAMVFIKLQSRTDPNFIMTVKAHVLKKLTSLLPEKKFIFDMFTTVPSIELADPSFNVPNKIDLLLGADVYGHILLEGVIKGPPGSPIAQKTQFGWILSGQIQNKETQNGCRIISMHSQLSDINELVKKFWELEEEPNNHIKILTKEEEQCETIFQKTTRRDDTGRYIVNLPFKNDDPSCKYGNSREICQRQFFGLERRLLNNPDLKERYGLVMDEYLSLGHMEEVNSVEIKDAVYLPHHAVVREDKSTTKVRVVFNASCKGSNGVSLNDELLIGPPLQPELRHLIMRWRSYPICLTADIIKMYRQIKVTEEHLDFQRILWRKNPNSELKHYRLLRVTFGTSAAPYLAVKSMQQLAYDDGEKYPLATVRILNDFYMDDLMSGCENISEGLKLYNEMTELLGRGRFQLQKWSSNSTELLDQLQLKQDNESENNVDFNNDEIVKILGLQWNRKTDEFEYKVNLPALEQPVTKRKLISDIAGLFDPLGWLTPVIIKAKVFIQRTWLAGIDWDQELPVEILKDWITYRAALSELTNFRLPRWIQSKHNNKSIQLHGFSDASSEAYAAVIYARIEDSEGQIHVSLLTSKSRVAPIKQISIPRLELCGAVLLTKLLEEVATTQKIPKENLHAWVDSLVVLAWLSSHPSKWKTFVGNRVADILTSFDSTQWSYVPSQENPADCASRGIQPDDHTKLELWKKGPHWLKNKIINYNRSKIKETKLEIKASQMKCYTTTCNEENDILYRFSSLRKLTRVVAYCKRFLKLKERNNFKATRYLTTEEINKALLTCIRLCQIKYFEEEISYLKEKGQIKNKSKLTSLNPVLDSDGILRVGGRLHAAHMNHDMMHPILIPHKSHFTNLIIEEAHRLTLHGGPQITLNCLRSKYWVLNARSAVRMYIRKCVTCVRHTAQPSNQLMGQLPTARIRACRPFLRSGVDYAGPISVRPTKGRGYHTTKGYICLFICMATRAIHLEIVSDMTSQAFLAAFKRFVARRGHVSELWSDNGTTFVGSAKELKILHGKEKSSIIPEIVEWLANNSTMWHFIPPHSPNFGGLWEAGIKSTKHHLKRVVGNSTLTFEEMTTVLCQIEACLNSRPISQMSSCPEDPMPLTPGHFLVGEPLVLVPDVNFKNVSMSSLSRWHLTQRMVQDFWRRWSHEYLTQLQHRYKWQYATNEPNVGDVVLVKEDDLPPSRWLYGLILEKHPGLDNFTRVVSLRCKNNVIKRPVSKLIILPVTT